MRWGFGRFSSYKKGVARCMRTIKWYTDRGATIASMIYAFAPASDGNYPAKYTNFVADKLGFHSSEKLYNILLFK